MTAIGNDLIFIIKQGSNRWGLELWLWCIFLHAFERSVWKEANSSLNIFKATDIKVALNNPFPSTEHCTIEFFLFWIIIRPISLDWIFFSKTKIPVFKPTTLWSSVRSYKHYTKETTMSGRHRKAFSRLQSCLTDSSWIKLILLIKRI